MASMTDPTKPRTDGVQPSLNGADPDRGDKAASPFAGISINFGADDGAAGASAGEAVAMASAPAASTPFGGGISIIDDSGAATPATGGPGRHGRRRWPHRVQGPDHRLRPGRA